MSIKKFPPKEIVPEDDILAVDDKVERGIDDNEQMVDNYCVVGPLWKRRSLSVKNISQLVNRDGDLTDMTDEEQDNDANQDKCDVAITTPSGPLLGVAEGHGAGSLPHSPINEI